MESINGRLQEIAHNIEIIGADPVTRHGFTQVPNFILTNKELSVGAKLAYAMLLKYAWTDDACFPGQQKLAEDIGAGERSVRTYLKEIEDAGFLEVTQRGLGKIPATFADVKSIKPHRDGALCFSAFFLELCTKVG